MSINFKYIYSIIINFTAHRNHNTQNHNTQKQITVIKTLYVSSILTLYTSIAVKNAGARAAVSDGIDSSTKNGLFSSSSALSCYINDTYSTMSIF